LRYGIISDIHSNLSALEESLTVAREQKVEEYLCLGDLVGYGASPNECCELVRALPAVVICGNHDAAAIQPGREIWFTPAARACILWTREVLTEENRLFLESLSPQAEVAGAILCHGSLPDPDFYTTTPEEALLSFRMMPGPLAFFGHTHFAEWFRFGDGLRVPEESPCPQGGLCMLEPDCQYLLNPGAVGQPRDGNHQASFGVWDTEAGTVEIIRLDYDIAAAQRRMYAAGLPENMALRLALGI
jgi:diadenosine tetraphosphatase ApaH/serine/threonine PP2A family protein phosphatase